MKKTPQPIRLVIDEENRTTKLDLGETPINVIELDPEQISGLDVKIAMNGGYSVTVSYRNGNSQDILIFANKSELLTALGNILLE